MNDLRSELLRWKKQARTLYDDASEPHDKRYQLGVLKTCDAIIELVDHYDDATLFRGQAKSPVDRGATDEK